MTELAYHLALQKALHFVAKQNEILLDVSSHHFSESCIIIF